MSHFSELKTQMKEKGTLLRALKNMGFEVEENKEGVVVRGFMGEVEKGEFKALTSTHYDIGFRKNLEGAYEVVADWEVIPTIEGYSQEQFMSHLKREYAKTTILDLAQTKGYSVDMSENEDTGEIEMVVTQW